jgi:hypothetical protein
VIMVSKGRFTSEPIAIKLGPKGLKFERGDIRIHGVDQSGPSFEGRVFLNNPKATTHTPTTSEHGYAGSFHVYGYGVWPDDIGKEQKAADADSILEPIEKDLIATDALREAAARGEAVTVTVVPVAGNPAHDAGDAMKLEGVSIEIHPT